MNIPYVKKISNGRLSFNAENLSKLAKISVNAVCDKLGNLEFYAFSDTGFEMFNKKVFAISNVGDMFFYFAKDFKLYFINKGRICDPQLKTFSYAPTILEIKKNGEHVVLVLDGKGNGYTIDSEGGVVSYSVPKGRVAAVYNGMLFIANKNELCFSSQMDFMNFTMDLNQGGLLKTDKNDGDIFSLVVQDGKLIVFTENAIYEFSAFGERIDYTLKKVETIIPSTRLFSAKDCGNKILFISGGRLYSYKNQTITQIESILDGKNFYVSGEGAVDKSVYYLPITANDGKKRILRYDVETERECLLDCEVALISDGGFTISNTGALLLLEKNRVTPDNIAFASEMLDFGTAKDKVIHEISMICSDDCILTIKSDCGEKKFYLKKGSNVKRMNIPSKTFTFEFSGNKVFNAETIKIKYRIKGE